MPKTLEDVVCALAVSVYGRENQIHKTQEELSELNRALSRDRQGEREKKHIAEEIADVRIMCRQLEIIYGVEDDVAAQICYKLRRLMRRIEKKIRMEARCARKGVLWR